MEEADSQEESATGWWPSTEAPGPAFYAYTSPEPDGIRAVPVRPSAAYFDTRLGEFILPYDAVRELADPDAAVLEFFRSTYEAGAAATETTTAGSPARDPVDQHPGRP